ncbi:MAG: HesA/MoeB/ThiF family protein [Bacteroidetes bacterium]|nr:HesA/MoeB/ThiF family protein [Bacteroidota bacterium]
MMQDQHISQRFHTQLVLPNFGIEAQKQLLQAKVLVIGAGGLGCPCIQYLLAAGIGSIGVCDGDVVVLSNLHRQILFTAADVGKKKAELIKERYLTEDSACQVVAYNSYLDTEQALSIFPLYDIIVDCTDDLATRYLINDASKLLSKPLVFAAIYQYQAQLAVFNTSKSSIQLRDVFEEQSLNPSTTCNEAGVLGAVTGLVGTLQALEVIKYLANLPGQLCNEMLVCDFSSYQFSKMKINNSNKKDKGPKDIEEFSKRDYRQACLSKQLASKQLDQAAFMNLIEKGNTQIVDVRNAGELPQVLPFDAENIPLDVLLKFPEKISSEKTILLFCHSGIRSQIALDFLSDECQIKNVFHLKGGILKWNHYD